MDRVLLGFVPTDLAFLKAGGRLSNVAFLGAHLLKIKPCIEVTGGKFVATKKFRGSMLSARAFIDHMVTKGEIDYSHIGPAYSVGLSEELRDDMEVYAHDMGFKGYYPDSGRRRHLEPLRPDRLRRGAHA